MIITSTALGQALTTIVTGLRLVLRLHAARIPALAPLLLLVIHNRLGRMAQRLDRLTLLWQENRLPKPRAITPPSATAPEPRPPSPQRPYIPSGQAWLIRLAQPSAQYITHLEIFLARPDTQALVEAAPQAGRILRPLCRMLGVKLPPELRRPRRHPSCPPAPPRPTRAHPPRRKPRSLRDFLATLPRPASPEGPDFFASHVFSA